MIFEISNWFSLDRIYSKYNRFKKYLLITNKKIISYKLKN